MKTLKKTIFSVLLLAFVFISFHDYAVVNVYSNTNIEISSSSCEEINFDMASHIHDSIHTLLVVPSLEDIQISSISNNLKPFDLQLSLKSHIGLVPQRPPLS